MKKFWLVFPLLVSAAFGQAVRYDNVAQGLALGNVFVPIANGSVVIYNYPGANINCATSGTCTLATTYIDDLESATCPLSTQLTTSTTTSCTGIADGGGNFGFWIASGSYQYCTSGAGFTTFCTNLTLSPPNKFFVGGANTTDIGAQVNTAYAALPANGGVIVITPKSDNACYNYTTPIVANVSGKYLLLEGRLAGGISTGCINFTPITGSAITLDYVPIGGSRGGVFGIRDLYITNNSCTSIGGCGNVNTGIEVTGTNNGIDGALMQNVSIQGFGVAYGENSRVPTSEVQWLNPRFFNNNVGMNLYGTAEEQIVGGTFYGNGNHIQSGDINSNPEIHITGTYFIAHSNEAFSFTNTTAIGSSIYLTDVHLENGANPTINAHYVNGNVSIFGKGGVAEDDSTSGTADWWFNPTGLAFVWSDLELVSGTRTPTIGILNLTGNTRTKLTGFVESPGTITTIAGGANAAKATVCMLNGTILTAASTCTMESPLKTPGLLINNLLLTSTAPTIASGFGTSPSIVNSNGTAVFEINVGTGGAATSGVITLPAATTGWGCTIQDMNTNIANRESAFTTTSITITAASAWTASDKLIVHCGAF